MAALSPKTPTAHWLTISFLFFFPFSFFPFFLYFLVLLYTSPIKRVEALSPGMRCLIPFCLISPISLDPVCVMLSEISILIFSPLSTNLYIMTWRRHEAKTATEFPPSPPDRQETPSFFHATAISFIPVRTTM